MSDVFSTPTGIFATTLVVIAIGLLIWAIWPEKKEKEEPKTKTTKLVKQTKVVKEKPVKEKTVSRKKEEALPKPSAFDRFRTTPKVIVATEEDVKLAERMRTERIAANISRPSVLDEEENNTPSTNTNQTVVEPPVVAAPVKKKKSLFSKKTQSQPEIVEETSTTTEIVPTENKSLNRISSIIEAENQQRRAARPSAENDLGYYNDNPFADENSRNHEPLIKGLVREQEQQILSRYTEAEKDILEDVDLAGASKISITPARRLNASEKKVKELSEKTETKEPFAQLEAEDEENQDDTATRIEEIVPPPVKAEPINNNQAAPTDQEVSTTPMEAENTDAYSQWIYQPDTRDKPKETPSGERWVYQHPKARAETDNTSVSAAPEKTETQETTPHVTPSLSDINTTQDFETTTSGLHKKLGRISGMFEQRRERNKTRKTEEKTLSEARRLEDERAASAAESWGRAALESAITTEQEDEKTRKKIKDERVDPTKITAFKGDLDDNADQNDKLEPQVNRKISSDLIVHARTNSDEIPESLPPKFAKRQM